MKKYILAASDGEYKDNIRNLLSDLRAKGIDITKHRYELHADEYYGSPYVYKFTAPGDWVAYLAMHLHKHMKPADILEYVEEFNLVDTLPSVASMSEYASENWWGDGDDKINLLKNIDTGKILYESGEYSEYEDEEDEW